MGLFKVLGGVLCAGAAIVAAPIVLPAVAATAVAGAGAVAAGAGAVAAGVGGAAAAGAGAVAAGAGAVAAGVGGAAAAGAGAVAAGATGALGAIGSTVGAAAGAAGLTSVATVASTTAGSVAVGTIASSAVVGGASAVSGNKKIHEAEEIKNNAISRYERNMKEFEYQKDKTNEKLEELGKLKINIFKDFDRFISAFEKIANKPLIEGEAGIDNIKISISEIKNIKAIAITVKDILKGGISSVGAGGLIGIATSGGAIGTITAASTGTAIGSLSGAAATNATLAALGGGSLATGGLGMAGGSIVLGGMTFAPMLAIGGIALNFKGSHALHDAENIEDEVSIAVSKMNEAEDLFEKLGNLSSDIKRELSDLKEKYNSLMNRLEDLVSIKNDYNDFDISEKKLLEKSVLCTKLLKELATTNLIDEENNSEVLEHDVKNKIKECKAKSVEL